METEYADPETSDLTGDIVGVGVGE